jgi:RES domain
LIGPGHPRSGPIIANDKKWRKGEPLHRIHRPVFAADSFNPCAGSPSRFAPLYDAAGTCVPTMYVGNNFTCALHESIFHDVPLTGTKSVRNSLLDEFVYSILVPQQDLRLADLTTSGLMKIGAPRALTECEPSGYHETVEWACTLRRDNPALGGLLWVARRDNEGRAMVLFGERVAAGVLVVQHGPIPLRYFETEIDNIAAHCDIDIVRR